MKKTWILFWGSLMYMELVYHFSCFGLAGYQPLLMFFSSLIWAGLGTLFTGFLRKKGNRVILWCLQILGFLIFASQIVYLKIFKQPLLIAAIRNAGGMAIKNYWREALAGIFAASGFLVLLAVPLIVTGILLKVKWIPLHSHSLKGRLAGIGVFSGGLLGFFAVLFAGFLLQADFYEEYREFYDPYASMEQFGVLASLQRDLAGGLIPTGDFAVESWKNLEQENAGAEEEIKETVSENEAKNGISVSDNQAGKVETEEEQATEEPETPETPGENVLPIDFEKLTQLSDTKDVQKLTEYIQTLEPTGKNEYTGMFEGYNLIYLTAEGFCSYAVDEELTPTLYKLTHSGFVADNYYVPLWQTSTSDGEYVNLTGLIPDQQFSMKRSAVNDQPFSLASYFAREGVTSYAYHNNTLSYYDRHLSHPNLGYIFKASKLGELTEEEWGDYIFPMEGANDWPSSDLNMMKATIPEYINQERFHVYYMTVSGHMNYNFTGNQMSRKHKAAVENLPYSEEGRAYIACNIELDKALEYLIDELEKAGKLDKTVICLSADHYPYAMDINNLEELAGKPLEGTLDIYRNSLILWNSKMETVKIEKACSALDLMPTLLNLFGFSYDSRLFAGRDMLSDSPAMVVFSDRSFITDQISYYKKDRSVTQLTDEVTDEEYLEAMRTVVKNMNNFSARILNNNYYHYIIQCLPKEWQDEWEGISLTETDSAKADTAETDTDKTVSGQ